MARGGGKQRVREPCVLAAPHHCRTTTRSSQLSSIHTTTPRSHAHNERSFQRMQRNLSLVSDAQIYLVYWNSYAAQIRK
jgi:hypothetical protein